MRVAAEIGIVWVAAIALIVRVYQIVRWKG